MEPSALQNSVDRNQTGEFEIKYSFSNVYVQTLRCWLDMHCVTDKKYPASKVQSIYMEDMMGSSYNEKINSDFLKTKYRIRWYENVENTHTQDVFPSVIFLEKKMKIGSTRKKKREKIQVPLHKIIREPLHSSAHFYWKQLFLERGMYKNIEPIIQISYIRKRYIEQDSKARINIDYDITIEKGNPLYVPNVEQVMLPKGVMEIKRTVAYPPESFKYVTQNMVQKESFSKYEKCLSLLKEMLY